MRTILVCLLIFIQSAVLQARETVVLIHGFLLSHFHMVPIQKVLRQENFDIYNFTYPSRNKTIFGHACNLVETLKGIACQNPGEPIHFVTHSIGGLVLRSALNLPGCPYEAKVGRSVLLAPPNQGSCLGRHVQNWPGISFIFGDFSGRELLSYTPQQMTCLGEFPSTAHVLVIAGSRGMHPFFEGSPNDRCLLVDETKLNTPHNHIVLKISHGDLITRKQAIYIVRDFLISRY